MALYAFDGTWNDSSAPESQRDTNKDTNVHRFRMSYGDNHIHYVNGVGTRYGVIGKLIGGLTGAGAQKRVEEQFEVLKNNFTKGDTVIDVVGYSRGAAIARMFVYRIGLNFDELTVDGKALETPPAVRFLGLFDTVASFGIPWNEDEDDFDADIPEFVENTFHAMALDETRETFGIERCLGNRNKITEVWFRGGHGDIGGNSTYTGRKGEESNRARSDIALKWMVTKAKACGLPVPKKVGDDILIPPDHDAPVAAKDEKISIGNAGTLSRRIHLGDLVHHTVEQTELTRGIDGRLLRRINTITRIEDEELEQQAEALMWVPPPKEVDKTPGPEPSLESPSLVYLSLRRYPFDILPARTWSAWLRLWELKQPVIDGAQYHEFWSPTESDRALAWDLYVELKTRIASQALDDNEGDDLAALTSIYKLFLLTRERMLQHGVQCARAGLLIISFLNQNVRKFTAKWHKLSLNEKWKDNPETNRLEFRNELKELQGTLTKLAEVLSHLADARL